MVKRSGEYAKNLSEGERSLLAFCYFIAMMDDELNGPGADKMVIVIDDPISSLDSSHIFFMFSLIESVIAMRMNYGQLFISTHNLDFLKYLKRITIPKTPDGKKSVSWYQIEKLRRGDDDYKSLIKPMPNYLEKYVTEYNFLFEQIYEMAAPCRGDKARKIENTYTLFYSIGNIMRKFLECYLYYRYPNTDQPMEHLTKFFDGHVPVEINRIINEYSHLARGDRGLTVMEVPEMETSARLILDTLRTKGPDHYQALCRSVGKDTELNF